MGLILLRERTDWKMDCITRLGAKLTQVRIISMNVPVVRPQRVYQGEMKGVRLGRGASSGGVKGRAANPDWPAPCHRAAPRKSAVTREQEDGSCRAYIEQEVAGPDRKCVAASGRAEYSEADAGAPDRARGSRGGWEGGRILGAKFDSLNFSPVRTLEPRNKDGVRRPPALRPGLS